VLHPGRAYRAGALRGRAYGELEAQLAAALPCWLAEGRVPEGQALKPPQVYRAGELVVKFFPPPTVFGWLRAPRAVRSAERYFACLPVPSPRPLVALARSSRGPSLLVREFLPGALLSELWGTDEPAERALADFLAAMLRQGVLHGDLHPRNLLWSAGRWVLLDVDGVRHRLHDRARVLLGQWARLCFHLGDEPRLERLFRRTLELGGGADGSDWQAVRRAARELRARRDPAARRPASGGTSP
jgi:tRNA A-37 threonylcarbamoyl transferase component Bud32